MARVKHIGVVILDCNQVVLTERCLRSIAGGMTLPNTIVIVANSSDPEPLRQTCRRSGLSPVVLEPGRNLGCAGGRNLGLKYLCSETDSDSFVILDNDTVVTPDFFASIKRLTLEPLEVIAPVIFDFLTQAVWSGGGCADPDGGTNQLSCIPKDSPLTVDWAPGACLIMSRATWLAVGRFDPILDFLFEDIEWCHRLRAKHGMIRVHSDLRLFHEAHQSRGGPGSPERVHLMTKNRIVYLTTVLRVSLLSTMRWIVGDIRGALRDMVAGDFPRTVARVTGLAYGLIEAARRTVTGTLAADA